MVPQIDRKWTSDEEIFMLAADDACERQKLSVISNEKSTTILCWWVNNKFRP